MTDNQDLSAPPDHFLEQGRLKIRWALQAQSLAYLATHYKDLPVGPQPVPGEINATIARWMVENLSRRGSAAQRAAQ